MLAVGVVGASPVGASTVAGRVVKLGEDGVEEGVGVELSGVGRSWTRGLGVSEGIYFSAFDFRGSGLESGTGLDRDFGSFFFMVTMLAAATTGFVFVFCAFFFLGSAGDFGAVSSSLEAALLFWALGSTSISATGLGFGFALAGEVGGV